MTRKKDGVTFECPRCGYRTEQDDIVKGCSHHCPENRGKLVALKKVRA